jgi:hypothetical protein
VPPQHRGADRAFEACRRLRDRRRGGGGRTASPGAPRRAARRATKPELRKEEAAPLILRAAAALGAEALLRQDLAVERTAQALARLAERIAALPDEEPHSGAGLNDPDCWRPATFEETNILLEELARRFEVWNAKEDAEKAEAAAGALAESEAGVNSR